MSRAFRTYMQALVIVVSTAPLALADEPAPSDAAPTAPPSVEPASPPKAAQRGRVVGTIIDALTEVGLPAATIRVDGQEVFADIDGKFEVFVAPGMHTITFLTEGYAPQSKQFAIGEGATLTFDASLKAEVAKEEVIEISSKLDTRSEAANLAVRRASTVVSDGVSAQEISKTPDASAGDAMKRVVSVSVVDGKYVALRGLEGRYVTAMLNGVVLPSTEPDRNAVPLDMFPTSLLANLTVYKSYGAELPGQFGGGTLAIDTNSFPEKFELKVSLSSSANTMATGQAASVTPSATGLAHWLGYDDGRGSLPRTMASAALSSSPSDGGLRNEWTPNQQTVLPNLGGTATLGDTLRVGGKRVGYLASGTLRRNFSNRIGENRRTSLVEEGLRVTDNLAYDLGEASTTVGTLANVGIQLAPKHDVQVFGLYTHVGTDQSGRTQGFIESDGFNVDLARLSFVERSLAMAQLVGKHQLGERGELAWQTNVARTTRDELDTRDMGYIIDPGSQQRVFRDQPGSGQRYWALLDEVSVGGGLNGAMQWGRLKLRSGATAQASRRSMDGRRFRYDFIGNDVAVLSLPAEQMLASERIGRDFAFNETTLQEDAYQANQDVLGAYLAADVALAERLKFVGGVRYEATLQAMSNGTQFARAGLTTKVDRTDSDVLPAANVILAISPNANLRGAYARTLARPRFRELAPFLFFDYTRRRSISGNPELATTSIEHGDVRYEYFPSGDEVFAVSGFAKKFNNPIEQVMYNTENDAQFQNAPGGSVYGAEVEMRVGLGRVHKALAALRASGNVALMRSQVELDPKNGLLTNLDRPMYGQSPYTANLGLEYRNPKVFDVNILYNVSGRRIADVGTQGLPDSYEEAFHRMDLVLARTFGSLKAKLSAANLLNQAQRTTQGTVNVDAYRPGMTFAVGLEWQPQ